MPKQKNIVVFFTDQQRADTCGCYGQPLPLTPCLDDFVKDGVLFENAYTCQPVCGPARAAIQSGVYPTKIGCFRNGKALPKNISTIAKHLNDAGYKTGYVGKWHLASEGKQDYETKAIPPQLRGGYQDYWMAADVLEFTSHGYDGYVYDKDNQKVEFKGYRTDCITDFALDFIRQQNADEPFFLFISHIEPHHQNDHKHYEGPIGSKERFKDFVTPEDLKGGNGDWKDEAPDYLGAVERLDYNFGRVLDTLKEKELFEDTVVFFTSDHGSHFKTRNFEYKRSCHDASVHIPFAVRGGEYRGAVRSQNVVSLIDLPASILGVAGLHDDGFHGRDLGGLDTFQSSDQSGSSDPQDDCAFIQISELHIGRAIRTRQFTFEVKALLQSGWFKKDARIYRQSILYDNHADPAQKNNLIRDKAYKSVRKQLREQLQSLIQKYEGKKPYII